MSNVPQHLIDEATHYGIVPGAVSCSAMDIDPTVTIVPTHDKWSLGIAPKSDIHFHDPVHCYILQAGKWATVITPAPAPDGLKEGDAVECGPAMRAAIIELAKELGVCEGDGGTDLSGTSGVWNCEGTGRVYKCSSFRNLRRITPEAFMAKMRVTAALPKSEPPIIIDGHVVKWEKGFIKVGCQEIPNDTVRAIAAKLIDP